MSGEDFFYVSHYKNTNIPSYYILLVIFIHVRKNIFWDIFIWDSQINNLKIAIYLQKLFRRFNKHVLNSYCLTVPQHLQSVTIFPVLDYRLDMLRDFRPLSFLEGV